MTDPRVRTRNEIDAYPAGAILAYHGRGGAFRAVRLPDGWWFVPGVGFVNAAFLASRPTADETADETPRGSTV